jgi:hypothetical protein
LHECLLEILPMASQQNQSWPGNIPAPKKKAIYWFCLRVASNTESSVAFEDFFSPRAML